MKETIGNRVGVYRRKIPLLRAAILFALIFALVTAVAVVLTHRPNTDILAYLFAYVTSWCLVVACLWLTPLIWKVTLFEGGIRGPTRGFGFRTLAWDDISSADRMPLGLRSLGIGFDAALCLQATGGRGIVITEPLVGMQELKEHLRRLAGEDHPFTRLLHER
ncbi:MAG TPA: hypothetical protein VHJ58_05760 [Vicinamibacterales bacterium]|jgi:hypothetical protein|nr:hypothetical protein [Vicinamibacterales bacterium]